MLPRDFTDTFNAAIKAKDWPLVVVLGESAVAENEASSYMLFNLGLAYLKTGNYAMANSILLSIPESQRDSDMNLAIDEGLRLSGSSRDELEIADSSIEMIGIQLAQQLRPVDLNTWCVVALGVTLLLGAILFGLRKSSKLLRVLTGLMIANVSVVLVLLLGLWIAIAFQSRWGAVVDELGAIVRQSQNEQSEAMTTLVKGRPLLVVGNPQGEWLRVLDSSGKKGWVKATHIRVVHAVQDL